MKFSIAIFGGFCRSALLGVKVVLSGLARQKPAAFSDLDALSIGFIGLNRHNVYPA